MTAIRTVAVVLKYLAEGENEFERPRTVIVDREEDEVPFAHDRPDVGFVDELQDRLDGEP